MERRRHNSSLPHGDRIVAVGSNDFNPRTDPLNLRRTNEDHLNRRAGELSLPDRALKLTSISITPDADVKHAETFLFRILDFLGQKDRARTGAESRLHPDELLQLLESLGAKEFQKS